MSSSNDRTINGYETIDGELVLSEITNSVLAIDSDGLVYGINNYISNLTSDDDNDDFDDDFEDNKNVPSEK